MKPILVYVGSKEGRARQSSLEVLSGCRKVADGLQCELHAVWSAVANGEALEALARYGPERVYTFSDPLPEEALNSDVTNHVMAAVDSADPLLVAFASSESTRDVLGALAVRAGATVVPDVRSFEFDGARLTAERPVMAARRIASIDASGLRLLVSVLPGAFELQPHPSKPDVVELPAPQSRETNIRHLGSEAGHGPRGVDLSEARVVVAAGRGVRDKNGRALVEELARLFGGAVGATRAVVESGLFPAECQIGQTGKTVSPELYFALGISGAIQHVAGMTGSRIVVAVNKDADAPIFDHATYGIVGDLYDVVPRLIAELKRRGLGA